MLASVLFISDVFAQDVDFKDNSYQKSISSMGLYKDDRSFHRSKGFAIGKYRLGIRNIYFKTITRGVGPLTFMITLLKA